MFKIIKKQVTQIQNNDTKHKDAAL